MKVISVLLVITDGFNFSDIVIDNLKISGTQCQLFVYNNGCNQQDEVDKLRSISSFYSDNNGIIKPFGECLNYLLANINTQYIQVLYEYGYMDDNWGIDLIYNYEITQNVGIISILENKPKEIDLVFTKNDEFANAYLSEDLSGNIFFCKNVINNIGAFDNELDGEYVLKDYCFRIKSLGFLNFFISDENIIVLDKYKSFTEISKKDYFQRIKNLIQNKKYHQQLFYPNEKSISIQADINKMFFNDVVLFNKIFGCISIYKKTIEHNEIEFLMILSSDYNIKFQIIPSIYSNNGFSESNLLINVFY